MNVVSRLEKFERVDLLLGNRSPRRPGAVLLVFLLIIIIIIMASGGRRDFPVDNLERQRKLLEQKRKEKRTMGGGVLRNDPPQDEADSGRLLSRPFGSAGSRGQQHLYGYDGPLVLQSDPDCTTPSIDNLVKSRHSSESEHDEMETGMIPVDETIPLSKVDSDSILATSTEPTWTDQLEEHVLPVTEQTDVNHIVNNLDQFVHSPARRNVTFKCRITRDKKGMDRGIYPTYYLHLEKDDEKRVFLLAARKRKKSATANYLISVDPTDLSRVGSSFVGKVRSNYVGTAFTLYDNGDNPKKAAVIGDGVRLELAAVFYETNVLGFKGPRKMTVLVPGIVDADNYRAAQIRPISEKDSIIERWKSRRTDELIVMHNKNPIWNEAEYVVMQFGRISDEVFTMDYRYPLSALQAFGIAMTSFHGKLACE